MTVKLALIGLGRWSMLLYSFLQQLEEATVEWGYDCCRDTAAHFTSIFENIKAADNLETILADGEIRGVVVATANHTHYDLVKKSLLAGKDVLVEKPLTLSLEEGAELIRLARREGRFLAVGHNTRYSTAVRKMKELLEAGAIGRVVTAHAVFSYDNLEEICRDTWRNDPRCCPGGPLLQLGVHHADNLVYLLGPVRSVYGQLMEGPPGSRVPAGGTLILQFEKGILGTLSSDYYTSPELFYIQLRGTEGELQLWGEDLVRLTSAQGKVEKFCLPGKHSVQEELEAFVHCIRTRSQPETGGEEGLEALRLILAGLESARLGRPVNLTSLP